ncbi:pentapeptide repeat-containing protein [Rhodococcus sp. NM-2]|uniref:pentapeptide repeat-containing protein n=1 Tax=Rhodococcus sp. NM-2 TaxID=3401174 RepID=UPI003AAED8BD
MATFLAGSAVALIAFLTGWLRRKLDREQFRSVRDVQRQQFEANENAEPKCDRRDRYTTHSAQLGHESSAVRLAGAYGLAALADEWVRADQGADAQTSVDLLRAYLRMGVDDGSVGLNARERELRKAVVEAIARRADWWLRSVGAGAKHVWRHLDTDLSDSCLVSIDLYRAHLAGITLSGANLSGAVLSRADLENGILDRAILANAKCTGIYARGADFENAYFRGADLRYANLTEANLSGADLTDADLTGTQLTGRCLEGLRGGMSTGYGRRWRDKFKSAREPVRWARK